MFRYDLLHNALKSRGISLSKLAELSGTAESTLKNLIYGRVEDPRISTIIPPFRALGLSIDEACGLKPEHRDQPSIAKAGEYLARLEDQQRTIMEQRAQIATLTATLAARDESLQRIRTRQTQTESELSDERRRARRMYSALVIALIVLFIIYIWDVRNPQSGLTAFFNQ